MNDAHLSFQGCIADLTAQVDITSNVRISRIS